MVWFSCVGRTRSLIKYFFHLSVNEKKRYFIQAKHYFEIKLIMQSVIFFKSYSTVRIPLSLK